MKILAIESSAGPSSCAVWENGRVLASSAVHTGLTHSQTLVPMIHTMLHNAGIAFDAIDLLAVASGPGSFTGIRIGVAAVKGLAFARNLPCVGVSTLAAMARCMEGMPFDGTICAAMDARCQQVYTATFSCRAGTVSRLTEDEALPLTELQIRLKSVESPILFVGDGAELCYNTFKEASLDVRLAPPQFRFQHAVGVAMEADRLSADGSSAVVVPADELMPVYLRLPQAERELRRRQEQSR